MRKTLSVFDESDSEEEGDTQNVNIITPQGTRGDLVYTGRTAGLAGKGYRLCGHSETKGSYQTQITNKICERCLDAILPGTIPQKKTAKS